MVRIIEAGKIIKESYGAVKLVQLGKMEKMILYAELLNQLGSGFIDRKVTLMLIQKKH